MNILELKTIVHYNPETGIFTWLKPHYKKSIGKTAGYKINSNGRIYWAISIKGIKYKCHRLAWFYMTGEWPTLEIDHKDNDSLNNKWENLREATHIVNMQNHVDSINNSGLPNGIRKLPSGNYQARISVNKKLQNLGVFDSLIKARNAYLSARFKFHDCPSLKKEILV